MTLTRPGAPARAYSSLKMTCSVMDAPRPPYSAGQPRQVQPPCGQHPLPAPPHLEAERLVTRAAAASELGELADQVLLEEPADLQPERHVLGAITQIHRPGSVAKAWHPI